MDEGGASTQALHVPGRVPPVVAIPVAEPNTDTRGGCTQDSYDEVLSVPFADPAKRRPEAMLSCDQMLDWPFR